MIALAATLVGCSRQPTHQAAAETCADNGAVACVDRTAVQTPLQLASFRARPPTRGARSAVAAKGEKPLHRGREGAAHVARKVGAAILTARADPPATHVPLPPPSPRSQREPKGSIAVAGSGTSEPNAEIGQATVGLVQSSSSRTIQELVATATAAAERMTGATAARGNGAHSAAASANNTDLLVAIVMVRPEIRSVSDLAGKNVAIDEKYVASSVDVRIAMVAAGAPSVQLSVGQASAVNRMASGEVPAAVLALVSADSADGFPEVAGFRVIQVPLSPRSAKSQP